MTFGMLTYCQILKIVKLKDEISVFLMVVEFWLLCVDGLVVVVLFFFVSKGSLVPSKGINSDN